MTSAMKKMNRLSSFLLSSTKSPEGSKPPSTSSSAESSSKNKIRKPPSSTHTEMSSGHGSAWPLPEPASNDALPTVVEPSLISQDAPQISASPVEELSQLDFGESCSPALKIHENPDHHYVPPFVSAQGPRSASSSIAPQSHLQQNSSNASLMPVPDVKNNYGNHSATDLSKPRKSNLLMKHQKSENNLRQNTVPANSSSNRSVSTPFQTSRAAPAPPIPQRNPQVQHAATMSVHSMPPPAITQPKKSKSWLFGGSSSTKKTGTERFTAPAWIAGVGERIPYDLNNLTSGAKVTELWNESGTVVVHLFPRGSKFGPSFRLNPEHIASSSYLASLAHGKVNSVGSSRHSSVSQGQVTYNPRTQRIDATVPGDASCGNSPNASHTDSSDDSRERDSRQADVDTREVHLFVPVDLSDPNTPSLSELDIQKLILVRNLFAFLVGQSLIATPKCPTTFQVFVQIANLLLEYGFSNMDCSTFGEVANASFTCYAEELGLLDVRENPQKAVEGLILGERMRSAVLWNEAFTHAVGRYSDIQNLSVPLINSLSPVAKQRVERAHMNLEKRLLRIHSQIALFEFPSIFSGIMNSRTAEEGKIASFDQWKSAFLHTRRFLLNHLKMKHKSWPPKKRRDAGQSVPALSRSVLQGLNKDLAVLYDLMVDRKRASSRLMIFGRNFPAHSDRRIEALRKVLQEYDQSGSPTYPVMPFDAPRLPRLSPGDDDASDAQRVSKSELAALLKGSYNQDTHDAKHPISQAWMSFEFKSTAGMTIDKVANFRLGSWLFIYCVIQALPMLTVDAPTVVFKEGVEYFLCEPPRGRLHWSKEGQQWEWFRDPVTGVVAQLAKDSVDLSDEAMYKLSHCWTQGVIWEKEMTDVPGRIPKTDTQRQGSVHSRHAGQFPSPPVSERRYSGASSIQGQPSSQQAPQHLSLQSLYMASQDSYSQAGSQPPTPLNGSPQLLGVDPRSSSPVHLPHLQYQSSPEMKSSPDPSGLEHPPLMPGILEEFPAAVPRVRRNQSPHSSYGGLGRHNNRESIFMSGLERLPVPAASSSPITREQRSARTASMTFDEILGPQPRRASGPNSPKLQEKAQSRARQSSRQSTR